MTANRIGLLCLAAYMMAFVVTFGHAAANKVCDEKRWQSCSDQRAGAGLVSASFWPLYWSLISFEKTTTADIALIGEKNE